MHTESQLIEVRDILLPLKAEEQRRILKQLGKQTLHKLYLMACEMRGKHRGFFNEVLGVLAIKDLYVMCEAVLGYNKEKYGSDMDKRLHGFICRTLDKRPQERIGWMIAREHLKTQIITVADSIRRVADDPNPPGVIISGIRDNAVGMIGSIKTQWDTNEILQELYYYRLPDKRKHTWNEDVLVFNGRTVVHKEPCLSARGAESELTSAHWSWAKLDDLVGRENSQNDEQLAKTINWWRSAQNVITPTADVDVIGTRYADGDLYGWLQDNNSPIQWYSIPALRVVDGAEVPTWPEYHTMKSLNRKRDVDMGPHDFSCQMMLDPIPKGHEEFREDMFKFYEPGEIEFSEIRYKSTPCDPAYTSKEKAASGNPDYSVIITGGWHPVRGLVVLDIDAGQVGTEKTINWLHKHQSVWGSKVGIETQGALEDYIRLHNESKPGKRIQYTKLKSNNQDKDRRIETLIPLASKQPIWLPKNNPYSRQMLGQFLRFPKSKKRDLMDCLAYLPQMVKAVKSGTAGGSISFQEYEPDNELTGY